jgi:AcrR family transcriptional regulator
MDAYGPEPKDKAPRVPSAHLAMNPAAASQASASRQRGQRAGRKVGRPSIAKDRRPQIVEAFAECVRRYGLHGATVERVAELLGISRSLVFHYFGDTHALVQAVTQHVFSKTGNRLLPLLEAPELRRAEAILDFLFQGPHYAELQDVVVMAEITSLAGRDKRVRAMLARAWEEGIEAMAAALQSAFPKADAEACRSVGYALICLAEQNWWQTFIGPAARCPRAARDAAELLVRSLANRSTVSPERKTDR